MSKAVKIAGRLGGFGPEEGGNGKVGERRDRQENVYKSLRGPLSDPLLA
jgi:hypothetical protein